LPESGRSFILAAKPEQIILLFFPVLLLVAPATLSSGDAKQELAQPPQFAESGTAEPSLRTAEDNLRSSALPGAQTLARERMKAPRA
jgi:hypothetical protein